MERIKIRTMLKNIKKSEMGISSRKLSNSTLLTPQNYVHKNLSMNLNKSRIFYQTNACRSSLLS
jgi:hypothetical protein